jgi:hypothetical protein
MMLKQHSRQIRNKRRANKKAAFWPEKQAQAALKTKWLVFV